MPTPRLIVADVTATSQNDLYAQVNDRLTADNMVKSTFLNAVSAREKKFPTGLDFGYVPVAYLMGVNTHKCVTNLVSPPNCRAEPNV